MRRRIGIYSGSFDPIHQGHIVFAQTAAKQCHLEQVVFLPEPKPRDKNSVTPIDERLAVIKDAIASDLSLSSLQLMSEQFSVRVTLPQLKVAFPNASFTLLIGSDVVKTFTYRWDDLDVLLRDTALAIGMRDGDSENEMMAIIATLEKQYNLVIIYNFIYTQHSHLASSKMRVQS